MFGEEAAAKMAEEQKARKEQGAKWCNCPSCAAASEILAKFGRVELEGFRGRTRPNPRNRITPKRPEA